MARCRPQVISAYPISPQTHIVEGLSRMVKAGELTDCEFVNVESEFGAMSVVIGASATGSRARRGLDPGCGEIDVYRWGPGERVVDRACARDGK